MLHSLNLGSVKCENGAWNQFVQMFSLSLSLCFSFARCRNGHFFFEHYFNYSRNDCHQTGTMVCSYFCQDIHVKQNKTTTKQLPENKYKFHFCWFLLCLTIVFGGAKCAHLKNDVRQQKFKAKKWVRNQRFRWHKNEIQVEMRNKRNCCSDFWCTHFGWRAFS